MKFDLESSSVTTGISIITKNGRKFYRISTFKWGPVTVPAEKVILIICREISKSTGHVLVDVREPNPSIERESKEAVIAGENEDKLKEYFNNSKVPYPGLSHRNQKPEKMKEKIKRLFDLNKIVCGPNTARDEIIEEIQKECPHKKMIATPFMEDEILTLCLFCGLENKYLLTRSTVIKLKKAGAEFTDSDVYFAKRKRLFKKLGIE